MLTIAPPADEAGFLGFAIADALLDLLVEKDVLTKTDATVMLMSVADRLQQECQKRGPAMCEHHHRWDTRISTLNRKAGDPHPIAEVSDLLQCCVRAVSRVPVSPIGFRCRMDDDCRDNALYNVQ